MRRVTSTPPSRNDKVVLTNSANQVCLNVPWIFENTSMKFQELATLLIGAIFVLFAVVNLISGMGISLI